MKRTSGSVNDDPRDAKSHRIEILFIYLSALMLLSRQANGFNAIPPLPVKITRISSRFLPLRVSSSQDNSGNQNDSVEEERRMAMVRYIQQSFYANDDDYKFEPPSLANGGLLRNLPLWRVPWVELPGRTNVLNVHEAVYTNMFETLLRSSTTHDDLYFGHLFLDKGTKNLKSFPVRPWNENDQTEKSASIGTLMRITDYRRLSNGRLLLLVQAIERFVVTNVTTNLPYSRADVQLVPDVDQWDNSGKSSSFARAQSLVDAFAWHPYEYEDTKFKSLKQQPDPSDIVGTVLAQVLPYAALDPSRLPTQDFWPPDADVAPPCPMLPSEPPTPLLETQLLEAGVLKTFEEEDCSLEDLELRVWWALNDYLLVTKTPVSPILLGFLPPGIEWPRDFVLHTVAQELLLPSNSKYVPVAAAYPVLLRQRKLSFHVAALVLRNQDAGILLQLSTTAQRLAYVLHQLEAATLSFQ